MKVFDILSKRLESNAVGLQSKCGVMLEKENGKQSLKFDVIPVNPEWDGWQLTSAGKPKDYDANGWGRFIFLKSRLS